MNIRAKLFTFMLCSLFLIGGAAVATDRPDDAFYDYLATINVADWTTARSCWLPEFLEMSDRLGITYDDIPAKFDLASPLIQNRDALAAGTATVVIDTVVYFDHDRAELRVNLTGGTDPVACRYFAVRTPRGWKLTSPLLIHSRDWQTRQTKFVSLHFRDESLINEYACRALDEFIENAGRRIGLSNDELGILQNKKIHYYLGDQDDVERLTGYVTQGMSDLAADAVITQQFPHDHEVAHLLTNFKLRQAPLFTLPFLSEGLACHLGGRWGRAPRIIKYAGYVNLHFGLAALDDVLTYQDFHYTVGSPDVAYPISAVFVDYLIRTLGVDAFYDFYRSASGQADEVMTMTRSAVRTLLTEAVGLPWDDLRADFDAYWTRYAHGGIAPYLSPMPPDTARVKLVDSIAVSIWTVGTDFLFEVDISAVENGGFLLISVPDEIIAPGYRSRLFAEHIRNFDYQAQRFGVRVSPSEVSLYDYGRDCLLSNFVYGFAPDSVDSDLPPGTYRFAIPKLAFGVTDLPECAIQAIGY